jgi:PAS domain S-box-containing protein
MPHGHCYLWQPETLWLNVGSDGLIAAAYFAIPVSLYSLVRRRITDIPFPAIFLMFAAFILLCGLTHVMEIWTVWNPAYRLSGALKLLTGIVSLATTVALIKLTPLALQLRSPQALQREVAARTAELAEANVTLRLTIEELERQREELKTTHREKSEADARLATTLRSVGDAVISTNASGTIQFMNAIAERLTAWSEEDARMRPLEEVFRIVHEQTRETVESPVAKVIREGNIVGLANHTMLLARDGTEVPIEDSGAPIVEGGQLKGVVLVFRDATVQRRAEKALADSEQRFRAAVDAVQGILWTNTADGQMRGEQPGWAALTGQSYEEYQGFGWSKAVHPDDAPPTVEAWLAAVRERRLFAFEHRVRRYDGQWRIFSIRGVPILNADGSVLEWVGVHTDITEQRESEVALRASEARFRALQDTSIDGFMVFESVRDESGSIIDFRWLHVNEAGGRIVGKPAEYFVGRRLLEEHPGNRDEGLFEAYINVVETGRTWSQEILYQRDDVDAYLRIVAARAGDGFAITYADLSERHRAEARVRESERQFVTLADAMPQLVWTERQDRTQEYFNRGWYAYTGWTADVRVPTEVWASVIHPEDEPRAAARWNHSKNTGEPYEMEFRLRRHDGIYQWFLARAVADVDEHGRILQWFGTCTDIDNTKRIEQTLRRTEIALREADRRKDVFLAVLSHELRSPLAPIRNAASLLEKSNLDVNILHRSQLIIRRQVQHMAALLDDLLDMSRITRGVFTLKKQYVDLRGLLSEAVEAARPHIDRKQHVLRTEWPDEAVEIEADPVRIVQIVSNLLTNAAKYTDPGGDILIKANVDSDRLVISVKDTGVGIAPEMLSKIFEMFSQIEAQQQQSEGGLGIGLALVKGLVELHGGQIQARSAGVERGSEFIVSIPCLHLPTGSFPQLTETKDRVDRQRQATTILVADDNQDGAESLAMLLRISGYEVWVAHTGPDALAMAAEHRPHIAVLDIGMPGMSGYDIAQRIRQEAWGERTILIAVTGWGQEDDRRKSRAAGFDHHLTKPVDIEVLERLFDSAAIDPSA